MPEDDRDENDICGRTMWVDVTDLENKADEKGKVERK